MAAMSIDGMDAHASLARGLVRLRLTSADRSSLDVFDAADRRVIERIPPAWRDRFEPSPEPNNPIARRLRDAFDPRRILNRGILGEDVT
jgi:FAD/FMN-containing dehydrogenase